MSCQWTSSSSFYFFKQEGSISKSCFSAVSCTTNKRYGGHVYKCIYIQLYTFQISKLKAICDWIYGNQSESHIGSYEIIDFKDFNTSQGLWAHEWNLPRRQTISLRLTAWTLALVTAHRTSRQITTWLDARGSIRDVFIRWVVGDGLVGKGYSSELW